MPVPGLPSAFVTVPATVTVPLGAAGLGVAVSVTVALGGPTWSVLGADVLPARVLPAAGLKVVVTVYVPGTPGAGNMSEKVEPVTGKVYCVLLPLAPVT